MKHYDIKIQIGTNTDIIWLYDALNEMRMEFQDEDEYIILEQCKQVG